LAKSVPDLALKRAKMAHFGHFARVILGSGKTSTTFVVLGAFWFCEHAKSQILQFCFAKFVNWILRIIAKFLREILLQQARGW